MANGSTARSRTAWSLSWSDTASTSQARHALPQPGVHPAVLPPLRPTPPTRHPLGARCNPDWTCGPSPACAHHRVIANDNIAGFAGTSYQLLPLPDRHHLAHNKSQLQQRFDGSVRMAHPLYGKLDCHQNRAPRNAAAGITPLHRGMTLSLWPRGDVIAVARNRSKGSCQAPIEVSAVFDG